MKCMNNPCEWVWLLILEWACCNLADKIYTHPQMLLREKQLRQAELYWSSLNEDETVGCWAWYHLSRLQKALHYVVCLLVALALFLFIFIKCYIKCLVTVPEWLHKNIETILSFFNFNTIINIPLESRGRMCTTAQSKRQKVKGERQRAAKPLGHCPFKGWVLQ